ncbi:MAG TPA: hypothetical protein VGP41_11850 [Candidatus Lustribacter sp.]|nr:hypothetical protein [Candidatus Lustribacter sp.]
MFLALLGMLLVAEHRTATDYWAKQLQRVEGTVGYQFHPDGSDFREVSDNANLPDEAFAVTREHSQAVLGLPDSSLISLGANTMASVSPFRPLGTPRLVVLLADGALRFDVRSAAGAGTYAFTTYNFTAEVRSAAGVIGAAKDVTLLGCLRCAVGSVTVRAVNQTFAPVSGQYVAVSADGGVATGTLTRKILDTFSTVGVPLKAEQQ